MRPVRYAGALVALVLLAGSVVLTVARLLDSTFEPVVLAASFVPWATVGYLVALLVFSLVLWRQPWGRARTVLIPAVIASALGLGLHVWWLAPSYVGDHATGKPDLTVVAFNMFKGRADTAATAAMIARERPHLLVLTEVTPSALAGLESKRSVGPGTRLPHLAGQALPDASGVVVASRFPVAVGQRLEMTHPGYRVRVRAAEPFEILAVHSAHPGIDIDAWRADQAVILREEHRIRGPHLVLGDFNATLDHPSLRELMGRGLADAARQANAGWQPTFPSPERVQVYGLPAPFGLVAIDHVLMSEDFSAVTTSAPSVRDSDHRALVARLVRRR